MKTALILIAATLTLAASLFFVGNFEECCEYIGLVAPEGESEVPGVKHAIIEEALEGGGIPETVPGFKVGHKPEPVSLEDIQHKPREIVFGQGRPTVLIWVSALCPTSKVYEFRINELAEKYRGRVDFWAINSAAMEEDTELQGHFLDGDPGRLAIPVLKDHRNVIADLFGARVSTDTFLFDGDGKLQYRGAIDDSRDARVVKDSFLATVIEELLAGKSPSWHYQAPKGCCPIDRVEPEPAPAETKTEEAS